VVNILQILNFAEIASPEAIFDCPREMESSLKIQNVIINC